MLPLSGNHSIVVVLIIGGKSSIGGADPPVIPVADEISPDDCPEFIRSHFLRIITVIQQF